MVASEPSAYWTVITAESCATTSRESEAMLFAMTATGSLPISAVQKSTKWQPSPMMRPPPSSGSCSQLSGGITSALTR